MANISVALITYSDKNRITHGYYPHIHSRYFKILLLAYALDNEEDIHLVDIARGERIPDEIIGKLKSPYITKYTFGMGYERDCLHRYLKINLSPESWKSTQFITKNFGMPNTLEELSSFFKLPSADCTYIDCCRELFCTPKAVKNKEFRVHPHEYPYLWSHLQKHCIWMVQTERAIRAKLKGYVHSDLWSLSYSLLQKINSKAFMLESSLLRKEIHQYNQEISVLCQQYEYWVNTIKRSKDAATYHEIEELTEKIEIRLTQDYSMLKREVDEYGMHHEPIEKTTDIDYPAMLYNVGICRSHNSFLICDYSRLLPSLYHYLLDKSFTSKLARAIKYVLSTKQTYSLCKIDLYWEPGCLCIATPTGNKLVYLNPHIKAGELFRLVCDGYTDEQCWSQRAYSTEDIVKQVADVMIRDIILITALHCEQCGIPVLSFSNKKLLLNIPDDKYQKAISIIFHSFPWLENSKIQITRRI